MPRNCCCNSATQTEANILAATKNLSTNVRYPDEYITGVMIDSLLSPAMNINGSITPVEFRFTATQDMYISRFNGVLVDQAIEPDLFGGIATLTNGVLFQIFDDGDVMKLDLFTGGVTENWEWSLISNANTEIIQGSADDQFEFGINLSESNNVMYLPQGWYCKITIQDDLTAITHMTVAVLGYTTTTLAP